MAQNYKTDWKGLQEFVGHLDKAVFDGANKAMAQVALRGEKVAVESIQKQVAPDGTAWKPLSTKYREKKIKDGFSEKIYVRTSSLFQAITSWKDVSGKKIKVYYGVKRNAINKNGENIANIAAIMEFGVNARPLWRPSRTEMLKWMVVSRIFHKLILKELITNGFNASTNR